MTLLKRGMILSCIITMLFNTGLSAQSSAKAIASATITEVVGASRVSENISNGTRESSMIFNLTGIADKNATRIIKPGEVAQIASFKITGNEYVYAVTLPLSSILERQIDLQKIEIGLIDFIDGSKETLAIAATLKPLPIKMGGSYTPVMPLIITINYN